MKSLAMMKMEKNFIAVLEKKYPRKPYTHFTIGELFDRLNEELDEFLDALEKLDYEAAKHEVADMSNLLDYIFEALCQKT